MAKACLVCVRQTGVLALQGCLKTYIHRRKKAFSFFPFFFPLQTFQFYFCNSAFEKGPSCAAQAYLQLLGSSDPQERSLPQSWSCVYTSAALPLCSEPPAGELLNHSLNSLFITATKSCLTHLEPGLSC